MKTKKTSIRLSKKAVAEMLQARALGMWSRVREAMQELGDAEENNPNGENRDLVEEAVTAVLEFAEAFHDAWPDTRARGRRRTRR